MLLRNTLAVLLLWGSVLSAGAFPLDSVLVRGDSCVTIVWTPDSTNTRQSWFLRCGATCTGSDTVCLHSDFVAGREYHGVAYSYGGDDPYQLFRQRLAYGAIAGSHLCHYSTCGDPSDSVTGIDCSAFNCWAWNEPRQSTSAMLTNSTYVKISRNQIAAGDVLVKSGSHSVMIVDQDDSTHFVIQEATGTPINCCRERLIDLADSYWNQYTPLRNPKITNAAIKNPMSTFSGQSSRKSIVLNGRLNFSVFNDYQLVRGFKPDGSQLFEYEPLKNQPPPSSVACGIIIIQAIDSRETIMTFIAQIIR